MNLLKKTVAVVFFSGLVGSAAYSQELTAVETAELGVQTLLQTVVVCPLSSPPPPFPFPLPLVLGLVLSVLENAYL